MAGHIGQALFESARIAYLEKEEAQRAKALSRIVVPEALNDVASELDRACALGLSFDGRDEGRKKIGGGLFLQAQAAEP